MIGEAGDKPDRPRLSELSYRKQHVRRDFGGYVGQTAGCVEGLILLVAELRPFYFEGARMHTAIVLAQIGRRLRLSTARIRDRAVDDDIVVNQALLHACFNSKVSRRTFVIGECL